MIDQIQQIKRPIIYICLSLIIASICYGSYDSYNWLAFTCAGLFFISVIIKTNINFTIIILLFFIIGIMISYNYYSVNCENINGEIGIVQVKDNCVIGKYQGRKIYVNNIRGNISQGQRFYVNGKFKKELDVEHGIVGSIEINKYKKVSDDYISKLYKFRNNIFLRLKENIGQRKAGLICSISFGYTDYLDEADQNELRNLGVIHAISVSGLHVAIVFMIVKRFLKEPIALIIVSFYVIFTGAAFSSIRSLFMIILLVFAKIVRKNYSAFIGLIISAGITTVVQPYCVFDIGFQLSYLATLGIILFSSKLNLKLYRLPKILREEIALSISAQLLTIPIIIIYFNQMPIASILGNLFIIPILNILIVLGNLSILLVYLPNIFDFISYIIIEVIGILDYLMDFFYNISKNIFYVNDEIAIVYGLTCISFYFISKGYKKFYLLPICAMIFTVLYIYSPIPRIDYIEKAGLLVSLNGDRKIISNINTIDVAKFKKINMADELYRDKSRIKIKGGIDIIPDGKNFILKVGGIDYYLKINNKKETDANYDIINFKDGKVQGFFILNNHLLKY